MKVASLGGMSHFFLLHSILAALVRHIYLISCCTESSREIWAQLREQAVPGLAATFYFYSMTRGYVRIHKTLHFCMFCTHPLRRRTTVRIKELCR